MEEESHKWTRNFYLILGTGTFPVPQFFFRFLSWSTSVIKSCKISVGCCSRGIMLGMIWFTIPTTPSVSYWKQEQRFLLASCDFEPNSYAFFPLFSSPSSPTGFRACFWLESRQYFHPLPCSSLFCGLLKWLAVPAEHTSS